MIDVQAGIAAELAPEFLEPRDDVRALAAAAAHAVEGDLESLVVQPGDELAVVGFLQGVAGVRRMIRLGRAEDPDRLGRPEPMPLERLVHGTVALERRHVGVVNDREGEPLALRERDDAWRRWPEDPGRGGGQRHQHDPGRAQDPAAQPLHSPAAPSRDTRNSASRRLPSGFRWPSNAK